MGIFTPLHPEITTGALEDFGFHKIKRQIKTIYVNIMTDFFMYSKKIHGLDISELNELAIVPNTTPKLYIERDFSYTVRKIPLVIPFVDTITERKSYLGNDNFLYPGVTTAADGSQSGYDVYANMYDANVRIGIVTESNELRDQLVDLLLACFTNYYRGTYTYQDDSDNAFIITPSTSKVTVGNESEITEENPANLVFISNINLTAFVEYHYKAYGEDRYEKIEKTVIDPTSGPSS